MTSSKSRSPSRSRSRSRKQRVRIAQIVEERLAEVTRDLQRTFLRMKTLKETGIRTPADEKTAEKLMEDELKYKCDYAIYNSTKKSINYLNNYSEQKALYQTMNNITNDKTLYNNLIAYKYSRTMAEKQSLVGKIANHAKQIIKNNPKKVIGTCAAAALGYVLNQYGFSTQNTLLPAKNTDNLFSSIVNSTSNLINAGQDIYNFATNLW